MTVDVPIQGWQGETGFVTEPLRKMNHPSRTTAFLYGPRADDALRCAGIAGEGDGRK